MASNSEVNEILEATVAGISQVARVIAALPDERRARALDAAEHQYFQTALNLGCSEEPGRAWAAAITLHLREQIEQTTESRPPGLASARPKDYSVAETILTRATGALALAVVSPLIVFIWIGLRLERPRPAIAMRRTKQGSIKAYAFVRGSGRISQFVRRAGLQTIPSLWHLANGDTVLRLKDFAEIIKFPRVTRPRA